MTNTSPENKARDINVHTVCTFLSDYAAELFGSGATCIRIDKNVRRMAGSMGMRAEFSILPRHVHITLANPDSGHKATSVEDTRDLPISFDKIALLSKLSWQMADGHIDFHCARRTFDRIAATPGTPSGRLLLLVAAANAAFCRLFGGDMMAMALVFIATMCGFYVKQQLAARRIDFRAVVMISAFVSAIVASAGHLFGLGSTPDIAVATSVLYLVPGIPFINSFCDMLDRHYLCAFGRLMNAIVICACLSLGLCAAMLLMNLGMF